MGPPQCSEGHIPVPRVAGLNAAPTEVIDRGRCALGVGLHSYRQNRNVAPFTEQTVV